MNKSLKLIEMFESMPYKSLNDLSGKYPSFVEGENDIVYLRSFSPLAMLVRLGVERAITKQIVDSVYSPDDMDSVISEKVLKYLKSSSTTTGITKKMSKNDFDTIVTKLVELCFEGAKLPNIDSYSTDAEVQSVIKVIPNAVKDILFAWHDLVFTYGDKKTDKDPYKFIGSVKESDPETIFRIMQGNVWSPNGEAKNLIDNADVDHTSMSVGDAVIVGTRSVQVVNDIGFTDLLGVRRKINTY